MAAHYYNVPREFAADGSNKFFHSLTSFVFKVHRRDSGCLLVYWAGDRIR